MLAFSLLYAYTLHFWHFLNDLDPKKKKKVFVHKNCIFIFLEINQYPVGLHLRITGYWPSVKFREHESGSVSTLARYGPREVYLWCLPWPDLDRVREMGDLKWVWPVLYPGWVLNESNTNET